MLEQVGAVLDQLAVSEEHMLRQSLSEIEAYLQRSMLELAREALMHRLAVDPRAEQKRGI